MSELKDISVATHIQSLSKAQLIELQTYLDYLGHTTEVDGIYGKKTLKAFNDFKKGNRLTHPNLIGKTTVDKLLELVDKVKRSSPPQSQKPKSSTPNTKTKSYYYLVYNQHFDRDKGQDYGRLSLNCINENGLATIKIWIATSSTRSKQGAESFHQRGGLIPPHYRTKTLANPDGTHKSYRVNLKSWHSNTRGIEGQFYHILPNNITTDKGGRRSEFGIHRDANVEGSMGCIVLSDDRFNGFHRIMQKLKKRIGDSIPLSVYYS